MNTRKFSKFEIATIKRTAQNVSLMVSKKNRLLEQIKALQAEYEELETMQEQYEAPIKSMTGGYGTEDLVEKVVETSGTDKNGRPIKVTKYVLKYPDTIIPPALDEFHKEDEVYVSNEGSFYDEPKCPTPGYEWEPTMTSPVAEI